MLSSSTSFKNAIRDNTKCEITGKISFANGKVIDNLPGTDFMGGTVAFDDSVSASGQFEIGAAIMNTFSCTLNNASEKFSPYDFTDAEIRPVVQKQVGDTYESFAKGIFTVERPSSIGSTITITAYDNMKKFEKPYSGVATAYPAALQEIVNDVCTYCGMTCVTQQFSNYNYIITKRPDDSAMTCLDVISYVAQISGNYARVNTSGDLEIKWYDLKAFDEAVADGGSFRTGAKPYSDGANLDGGNFTDYGSGSSWDGSRFTDYRPYHIYAFSSFEVCTDDVVITGIKVVTEDADGNEVTYRYGKDGYVLSIENNPFVTDKNKAAIAKQVGDKIIGMRFRPFNVSALSDPTLEAGDAVTLIKNGILYHSYLTHCSYKMGNYETFECSAETPSANSSTRYSAATQTYVKARKEARRQITAYDVAVQRLTNLITNSFGVFKTEEGQPDGSVIYYMHNKPKLSDSDKIWKMTADAFAVSSDGGKTWNAGFDTSGNAVLNILNAIGINADWINVGDIQIGGNQQNVNGNVRVYDASGKLIFSVNKSGIILNTPNFKIGSNGNVTVTGNLYGLDKLIIRNDMKDKNINVVQYVYSTEDTSMEFRDQNNNVIMKTSDQTYPVYFPQETAFESAIINGVKKSTSSLSGIYMEENTAKATLVASGIFVNLYGEVSVFELPANSTYSMGLTVLGGLSWSLYYPNHVGVNTISYIRGIPVMISISTSGTLTIRNLGTTVVSGTAKFRFDYTTM